MPTQDQYESYDKQVWQTQYSFLLFPLQADIQKFKDIGDASRIAMILQVKSKSKEKKRKWEAEAGSDCNQADASVRSLANWFSLGDLAGDKSRDEMSVPEGEAYDNLLRDLTNVRKQNNISGADFKRSQANTQLIRDATETLEFNSIEQLEQAREKHRWINIELGLQGASTLSSITSQLAKGGDMAKTLDMKGREAAVEMISV